MDQLPPITFLFSPCFLLVGSTLYLHVRGLFLLGSSGPWSCGSAPISSHVHVLIPQTLVVHIVQAGLSVKALLYSCLALSFSQSIFYLSVLF